MKSFNTIKLVCLIILLFSISILGQGTMSGVVSDSTTGETLVGANVILLGTALGSATDLEGYYRITQIPEGNYRLKVSYVGYLPKEFNITITESKALVFDVALRPDILEGEEVVITAQAVGQIAAINQQLASNTIINVVSEEKIQELPDANAAEAIGRLPGISLQRSGGEANKIVLRGLSDKYTSVTLDGISIPSTDDQERGVDLSTISQSSLAGIELYKALTSDKDADAIAGSVNLVTKKAPLQREIKAVLKGGYNDIMSSVEQYDFSLKYGERFFDNILGFQLNGNLENKIRSKENIQLNYLTTGASETYQLSNLILEFTDEIRKRDGLSVIFDVNTPDDGNIKLNSTFNSTKRDYIEHQRDYPNGGGNTQYLGGVTYSFRDREQEIRTFSTSLTGDNYLLGMKLTWGLSFAESKSDFPYDYQIDFSETGDVGNAGMKSYNYNDEELIKHPEMLIPNAYNNFQAATLAGAYYSTQKNFDKDKSAFLNFQKEYIIGDLFAGELKIGGKYRSKSRNNNITQNFAPYYLGYWRPYKRTADGTIVPKDFSGSYFEDFYQRYQENNLNNTVSFQEFLDTNPESRQIYDKYNLNPLINRDKLRQWYEINNNGVTQNGALKEYYNDPTFKANDYDITEAVASAYLMNTFKFGQDITFIAGVRAEKENNDYRNTYSRATAGGFPSLNIVTRDTSTTYSETIVLPNFHLNVKATDFLNIRIAAYKALARPDFNMRLSTYFAWRPAAVGGNRQLVVGNPDLKTAKAWNFEINTAFYGNEIGLFSVSAFYKEIEDMYHMLNQISTTGNVIFQKLGLSTTTLHDGDYQLTIPYNSPKLSKVWGFEIEHQMNFTFLPGLLKNIVLSYNASIVRSETQLIGQVTDTTYTTIPGFPPIPNYNTRAIDYRQQLEDQPEFFGNISLGYDIGGFSGRISLFHQGEYFDSFSASRLSDRVIAAHTRLDLALKQKVTDFLSVQLNINNLTNVKDENLLYNQELARKLLRAGELYGLTVDLGVRVDL